MSKSRDYYREIKICAIDKQNSPIIAESGALPEASGIPKWRGLYAGHQQMSANFYTLLELFFEGLRDPDTAV
jgi:hypothetical protein